MTKITLLICFLIGSLVLAMGLPYKDSVVATSDDTQGRVQIKVYRGPTEYGQGQHFAPWGYWVKQPAADGNQH